MTNSAICDECIGAGEFEQICVPCHGTGVDLTDESACGVCHGDRVAVQECPKCLGSG
ncbi:hypothetical protein [Xenorhabdus thuongxuanensis]|uniref:hypothetical protein n=1 Tax=Xenorhabdus thuongxuanensis TaxID=1873484 RepID=UPI000AC47F3C|nr:hypothetical protein [Xenorhabdus thuongxuanensis]